MSNGIKKNAHIIPIYLNGKIDFFCKKYSIYNGLVN
jgi:hypothetical protein